MDDDPWEPNSKDFAQWEQEVVHAAYRMTVIRVTIPYPKEVLEPIHADEMEEDY